MKLFAILSLFMFLSACATMDPYAQREIEKKAEMAQTKLSVTKSINKAFDGKKVYLTSHEFCDGGQEFTSAKIISVDVTVDGSDRFADFTFNMVQGGKPFSYSSGMQDLNDIGYADEIENPWKDYLFDSNKRLSASFDCLSSRNPVTKYHLSRKERRAIKNQAYFTGMSETAFILAVGRPSKINRSVIANHHFDQWIRRDSSGINYYYFRNHRLASWQNISN